MIPDIHDITMAIDTAWKNHACDLFDGDYDKLRILLVPLLANAVLAVMRMKIESRNTEIATDRGRFVSPPRMR